MNPCSLVMRKAVCFYCGKEQEADERTIGHHFGIRYCSDHKADAKRDSNAYLHRTKRVRASDALKHDVIGPFFQALSHVHIRRSSGVVEGGWRFQKGFVIDTMIHWSKGDWIIPMTHDASETIKSVPLSMFAEEAVRNKNDTRIGDLVDTVRSVLEEGVYKSDSESTTPVQEVLESENIHLCYSNGLVGRVFIPKSQTEN
uniref:Uncharacterized protein n=1 Tax=viral metagenome TaxID=1070528 RepID=A0A6C0APW5_9ZZZZ